MTIYLYVIEIADRVKVGQSMTPEKRLITHRATARNHGVNSGRSWISDVAVGSFANESLLIDWCAERASERVAAEYFVGLDFDEVVAYATTLLPWAAPPPPKRRETPRRKRHVAALPVSAPSSHEQVHDEPSAVA